MRIPVIAANWKLHKTIAEARDFVQQLKPLIHDVSGVDIVICPVFTSLHTVFTATGSSAIAVGAQDIFWKESGAYTGEISGSLLKDAGCQYVIIGHSERRGRFGVPEEDLQGDAGKIFGDTDAAVNLKVHAALQNGLTPIICVGETLEERESNQTDGIVQAQVEAALAGVTQIDKVIFAYEPVWAIGTGKTCDTAEAGRVCGHIRGVLKNLAGEDIASAIRIQYGGSVKAANAAELLGHPEIDGALVGGASLEATSFAPIIAAAAK